MQPTDGTLTELCCEAPAVRGGVAVSGSRSSGPLNVKKRSSLTCVGDCSTTPSSMSLSSSVDFEALSGNHADEQCGWGPIQPRCCQVFRNHKVVLFFLCCLATIQVDDFTVRSTWSSSACHSVCVSHYNVKWV